MAKGATKPMKSGKESPRNYDPKNSVPVSGGKKPNKAVLTPPKGPHNEYRGV